MIYDQTSNNRWYEWKMADDARRKLNGIKSG